MTAVIFSVVLASLRLVTVILRRILRERGWPEEATVSVAGSDWRCRRTSPSGARPEYACSLVLKVEGD